MLEKKRSKLVSRVIRKSSEIDDLMYSFQNGIAVKEELQQLNDMFKMLVEIHEELENIDDQYTDELWFEEFIRKFSPSSTRYIIGREKWRSKISQEDHPMVAQSQVQKSSSSRSSKRSSTKEKAVAEKLKVAELIAEVSFIQKRREAELQAEALKVEQELAKAQARVRVLDKENKVDQNEAVI